MEPAMQHHDISRQETPHPPPVNEVARVAIVLAEDTSFYRDQRYIAVAFDAAASGVMHEILGASRRSLPFLGGDEIFSHLCEDRAIRTVDGSLRTNGETITPERYLGLWRSAISQPWTPSAFTERYGYAAFAVLGGCLDRLRGKRTCWRSSPFETFDDVEAAHRERIAYLDDGRRFRIELDLRLAHAARDAFYLESFLSLADQGERSDSSIVLKVIDPSRPSAAISAARSDLFTPTAEAT
jgi:hypothetical protein